MNVSDVGSLYYGESSLGSLESLKASSSAPARVSSPLAAVSPFEKMLEKEKAALSPEASKRPLGAAANGGAKDYAHAKGKTPEIDRSSKLYDQCRELETFLVKNMLKSMRDTVQKGGLDDGGFAGEMYEDMLYDRYADSMARNAGFGLSDQVYLELSGRRGKAAPSA